MKQGVAEAKQGGTAGPTRGGVFPSRFCALLTLSAGLFIAWWEAFHEIACGGISIRTEVPLLYTYMSCYAHAVGCALGAVAALMLVGRSRVRPSRRPDDSDVKTGALPLGAKRVVGLYAALAALTVLFFACLACDGYALAALVQVLFNACAMVLIVAGVSMLSCLALSDATFLLFGCLALFVAVDNLVLPALVYATGRLISVLPAFVAIACALPLLARSVVRAPEWAALGQRLAHVAHGAETPARRGDSSAPQRAAAGKAGADWRRAAPLAEDAQVAPHSDRIPWQPLFHVAAYGLVFGLMHVEASSLIVGFFDRNLSYGAGAVLAAALFYACFARTSAGSFVWPKMRMVVFPLGVASFLMLPLLGTLQSFFPVALINAANLFYDAALMLAVLYVARETPVGVVRATCIAVIVKMAFFLLGAVLCHVEINALPVDVLHLPLAGLAAFALLVAATLWVGDDNRARKMWGLRVDREPRHAHQMELQAKCNYLAKRYRLTPKEREVAFMLASGRRVNQIAEDMLVSVSTTRTHVRNLYAALDVHSHAELTNLIESIDSAEAFSTGA